MDSEYAYTKKRMHFGKKCNFSDFDKTEVEVKSNPALMSNYVRMDPVTHATQCSKVFAVHEVNTTTATYKDNKMFHYEGGWPKDINMKDLEQTVRYRRKIEKDELYIHTMLQNILFKSMEHCILQNNACNIYEEYFADVEAIPLIQRAFSRTVNVYRDPLTMKRQITHLSWSPDQGNRFAASYCNVDFKKTFSSNYTSYIWEVENPNNPYITLKPFCPILTLEYSPKDSNTLIGGLITGQVGCWDLRRGPEIIDISSVEFSHRDPCDKTLWINSKTGTEFFSASKDGQIKWWDTRKLQVPTETLVIDLSKPENQNVDKATGISTLQFEPSMGTRFMCGLENGIVISGNRKGKTPGEKIATRFRAQYGPVISLERNPTFVKNFLTVGDWTSRIWSEDCRESCIAWTPGHRDFLTGGAWSATRYSVYYLIKVDGTLDVWDFLIQEDSPVLSIKVCDESLTCLRPHEQGQLAAVANKKGSTYLLEFSEALTVNQKNDKLLLTALLDRETRREKVIEAKNREQRLKMRTLKMHGESDFTDASLKPDEREESKESSTGLKNTLIVQCEQEYENIINTELTRQAEANTVELNNNVMQNERDMYTTNPAQNSQNVQLDLSTLFQFPRWKQRQILGQYLYPLVYNIYPNFMPHKLTDILLDVNSIGVLISMLNDLELFHLKLKDAVNVLQTYYVMAA
ncbi:Dynein intermediate chain 2, axonemal [Trachymyrmex cornetzi]|uniref:Dynein intermediate chain 2, axonemal n=1 Tax=Trachymyrmex cornetzi TaxID=471704 RepID=A0A195DMF1_9HYME|nr:Dynein intermediate chain 2, axonemal [Trachymyrmex cornetzi]